MPKNEKIKLLLSASSLTETNSIHNNNNMDIKDIKEDNEILRTPDTNING